MPGAVFRSWGVGVWDLGFSGVSDFGDADSILNGQHRAIIPTCSHYSLLWLGGCHWFNLAAGGDPGLSFQCLRVRLKRGCERAQCEKR